MSREFNRIPVEDITPDAFKSGKTPWDNIQNKQYDGYGVCIYCGDDGGIDGLRDEHIIPYSLGGNTVIRKASCIGCERILNPVDTHLAKAVFGNLRIHNNIQTCNPKDRPTKLPAQFTVSGRDVTLNLPIKDHPYALALPVWGNAGFLRGSRIDDPSPEMLIHIYHHIPENIHETLRVSEDYDYKVWATGRIDLRLFARGIAKIAYCHSVLHYGIDGFRRLALVDLILGKFSPISYFVGAPLVTPPPPFSRGTTHGINFSELVSFEFHTGLSADPPLMKLLAVLWLGYSIAVAGKKVGLSMVRKSPFLSLTWGASNTPTGATGR